MIGVDWGSSSFRAYRIAADGVVTDRHAAACGALSLKPADFPPVLSREIGGWLAADDGPVLLCGMVGSRQGWREAGYVACPASAADLAGQLLPVQGPEGRTMLIVPGLQCRDPHGVPDVLRGEEMQLSVWPEWDKAKRWSACRVRTASMCGWRAAGLWVSSRR